MYEDQIFHSHYVKFVAFLEVPCRLAPRVPSHSSWKIPLARPTSVYHVPKEEANLLARPHRAIFANQVGKSERGENRRAVASTGSAVGVVSTGMATVSPVGVGHVKHWRCCSDQVNMTFQDSFT